VQRPKDWTRRRPTMVTAIVSVMTGVPVRRGPRYDWRDHASGRVWPIAGIKGSCSRPCVGASRRCSFREKRQDLVETRTGPHPRGGSRSFRSPRWRGVARAMTRKAEPIAWGREPWTPRGGRAEGGPGRGEEVSTPQHRMNDTATQVRGRAVLLKPSSTAPVLVESSRDHALNSPRCSGDTMANGVVSDETGKNAGCRYAAAPW